MGNPSHGLEAGVAASNRRMLRILVGLAVGIGLISLFGFTTLYSLWCNATGTAMRPNMPGVASAAQVSTGRFVDAYFEGRIFDDLPVRFSADQPLQRIEVGKETINSYHFQNLSDRTIRIRPIHQVSPINATRTFGMRLCFCFQDQVIGPHETKDFPVAYTFSANLDQRIKTVTLCYSVFNIAEGVPPSADMKRVEALVKAAAMAEDADADPAPSHGAPVKPTPGTPAP